MKRSLALLLTVLLALTLVGCAPLLEAAVGMLESELLEALQPQPAASGSPEANGASPTPAESPSEPTPSPTPAPIDEDDAYDSKDDVALYLYTYGHLPANYITKAEARVLGWEGGSLKPYAPDECIGGDRFGNYEGLLPSAPGRAYTECDIDTLGKSSRGSKRIVFSNDGLIYYTDDHYESFELLYGEE